MKQSRQEARQIRAERRAARGRKVTARGIEEYQRVVHLNPVYPKGQFQKNLLASVNECDATFVDSPAGSGKTFVVMSTVVDWLKQNKIKKIILTRPSVGMGRTLGLLPGSLREKFEPYLLPLVDVIIKRYGREFYETQVSNKNIEFVPLEYVRGRSFEDAVVICDEFQNTLPDEAYSIMTRLGEGSKLIAIGDASQNDMRGLTGLQWAVDFIVRNGLEDYAGVVQGTSDDIVRSGFCRAVVKAKEEDNKRGI